MALDLARIFGRQPVDPLNHLLPYCYTELESSSHTRLVELLPTSGSRESPLRCKIHHVDLKYPTTKYTALSYAWGDLPVKMNQIECDGAKISITPNLASALLRLRQASNSCMLWVDAICIQQSQEPSALKEKSSQIGLMSKIFRTADQTIVDLGAHGKEDVIVIQSLRKYCVIVEDDWKAMADKVGGNFYREPWQKPDSSGNIFASHNLPNLQDRFWQALWNFLTRPWFIRLWVVQEYVISQNVRILIGKDLVGKEFLSQGCLRALFHQIYMASRLERSFVGNLVAFSLATFKMPITWMKGNRELHVSKSLALKAHFESTFGVMARASFTWRGAMGPDDQVNDQKAIEAGMNLCTMLFSTRRFKVTDDRDRIYALLGIVGDGQETELYVNYQEPLEDLSIRVSRYMIKRRFGGQLLLHHCVGASELQPGPSWSIDLRGNSPDILVEKFFEKGTRRIFTSGGPPKFFPLRSTENPGRLAVEAISLGYIMFQTEPLPRIFPDNSSLAGPHRPHRMFSKAQEAWQWTEEVFAWVNLHAKIFEPDDILSLQFEDFKTSCYKTLLIDLCMDTEKKEGSGLARLTDSTRGASLLASMKEFGDAVESDNSEGLSAVTTFFNQARQPGNWLEYLVDLQGKRLGVADSGPCLLPAQAQEEDEIVVLLGHPFPFVVRAAGEEDTYRIVGICYVHGMMDGQALEMFGSDVGDIFLS
jgi:hypothetical protein